MTIKINGDNTVANPGFSGDDTDTGLQVGTNELKLVTGGTARATVDSSGNVGIGATTVDRHFHVEGTANVQGKFQNNGSICLIEFEDTNTTAGNRPSFGSVGNEAVIHAAGSERMRIASDGNVKIVSEHLRFNTSGKGIIFGTDGGSNRPSIVGNYTSSSDNNIVFNVTGSERMRINSSGQVGIGTSNPGNLLDLHGAASFIEVRNTVNDRPTYFGTHTNGDGEINVAYTSGNLIFKTGGTERARFTSGGSMFMGTTTNYPGANNTNTGIMLERNGSGDGYTLFVSRNSSHAAFFNRNTTGDLITFRRGGSEVGEISVTSSSTSYNTSSDYRLKENVVDITNGITRVKQLQPKRFNFIVDAETTVDGFLAHEAQTVVPEAVTGTHNEVDGDGNPIYQGIDQAKLVPLLTAALQETIAKIETLETQNADLSARITALETA